MRTVMTRVVLFGFAMMMLIVAGCNCGGPPTPTPPQPAAKTYHIGITQIVTHPGIDAVRAGFIAGLKEAGIVEGQNLVIDFQNAEGDMNTQAAIAQKFAQGNLDLIFAISTPSAQAVAKATKTVPIVFGAVTDPVSAGLVASIEQPGGNITGTSDVWPYQEQLELLLKLRPGIRRLGVVYNPGESNAAFAMKQIADACARLNIELKTVSVSKASEILLAAKNLISQVDAMYSSADNTVIAGVESLVKVCREAKKPLLAGESDSVKRGAVATLGTNYTEVGRVSGQIAARILHDGENPGRIPVSRATAADLYLNPDAAARMGVTITPEMRAQAKEVFGTQP